VAAGLWPDWRTASLKLARVAETLEPNPAAVERYTELYALYRQVYAANRAVLAGLARWRS
jgi:sugar (pentulose or hexulose) kinase